MAMSKKVTISSGGSTSNEVSGYGMLLTGVEFPSEMTGTGITFTTGPNNAVVRTTANDGAYTITKSNGNCVPVNQAATDCLSNFKIVSSTNEAADREFVLYFKND